MKDKLSMKRARLSAILSVVILLLGACDNSRNDSALESKKTFRSMQVDTEFDGVIFNGRTMYPETDFDAVRNVGVKV
jgi:hypothetical protein